LARRRTASHGLRTSPVSWLGGSAARLAGPLRGLPATPPGLQALRRSGLRSVVPPYSRASATASLFLSRFKSRVKQVQPAAVARLPEHEVRDDCEGPKPTVDDVCCFQARSAGVNDKTSTVLAANSHGVDRSALARRSTTHEKPVPANRAERHSRAALHAGSCLFGAAPPDRRIPPQG
jgi:hypothetical protein